MNTFQRKNKKFFLKHLLPMLLVFSMLMSNIAFAFPEDVPGEVVTSSASTVATASDYIEDEDSVVPAADDEEQVSDDTSDISTVDETAAAVTGAETTDEVVSAPAAENL